MINLKDTKFLNSIRGFLDSNAPTIATFGSVLGVAATVYFMHRAAKNAAKVEEKYEEDLKYMEADLEHEDGSPATEDDLKMEKNRLKMNKYLQLIYIYRWALLSGIGSAGFAFLSNYLNGRTIATITGLLALNNDKLREYAKKGKEMIGEDKFKELQDSVEKEIFGEKLRKGELKVEKSKPTKKDKDDTPWTDEETYYVPWNGETWVVPKAIMNDAIKRATEMFKKNSVGMVADKSAYLDFNTLRAWCRIPSVPAYANFYWDAKNPFNGWITTVSLEKDGWMKALALPNEPMYDTSTTR